MNFILELLPQLIAASKFLVSLPDMRTMFITYLFACLLASTCLQAQISHGGQPLPWDAMPDAKTRGIDNDLYVTMPEFDLTEQLRLDSLEASDLKSGYRFAYKFMTDYTPDNSGVRFTLPDGTKVWRLGIRSVKARSINIMFSKYRLPEGARLFLYNRDRTEILGSFNHLNNSKLELLPIAPIQGDELIVEYQEPAKVAFPGELVVGEVNHGYRDMKISGPAADSEAFWCMPTLACYQDTTEQYNQISKSVVLLIINGNTSCTGTIINNTTNDKKPYLLTASHCLNGQFSVANPDYEQVAGSIVCYFNYESPDCNQNGGQTGASPKNQTMASAHYRAVNENTDMALLELLQIPPASYNPYYAGWNAADEGKGPYIGIHHPGGSVKRMNLFDGTLELDSYDIPVIKFNEKSHWKISKWTTGSTAGGSSGSPLFDSGKRIIGGLTGGASTCGSPTNDYYYALKTSWDVVSDSSRQLKCWLDPIGLATPACNGIDPYEPQTSIHSISLPANMQIVANKDQQTLHINLPASPLQASLTLVAMDGKTVAKYAIQNEQTVLQVGTLPSGIYIVKLILDNKLYTQKVLF